MGRGLSLALVCCYFAVAAGAAPAVSAQTPATPVPQAGPTDLMEQRQQDAPITTDTASTPTPQQATTGRYTLSRERYEKAVSYSRAGYILYFVSTFISLLALVFILRSGVAAKYRDIAEHVTAKRWLQGLLFIPLLVLTLDLVDLPVRLYGHALSLRYQQSVQGWRSWMWDWTKEELLGTALAIILGLILFAVMRRSPRRWWIYFWLVAVSIGALLTFASPWIIDPLFNKFEPLANSHPELVGSIEKLTQRAGVPIPASRMFLMKASDKTNAINAYVTGLGASKRMVIYDTTLQKTTNDETLFIVGHEMGHYVLGHVTTGFVLFALGLFVGLYIIFRGLHWALQRWGPVWKIRGADDWASLAVLLLLVQALSFVSAPLANGFSRRQEHAADVFGLEVIHGIVPNPAEVAAHSFQVIGEIDLADPNPPAFIAFWLYSHAPLAERLVFAYSYDPWSRSKSPQYVK
jgi:STE24 endopeptidase